MFQGVGLLRQVHALACYQAQVAQQAQACMRVVAMRGVALQPRGLAKHALASANMGTREHTFAPHLSPCQHSPCQTTMQVRCGAAAHLPNTVAGRTSGMVWTTTPPSSATSAVPDIAHTQRLTCTLFHQHCRCRIASKALHQQQAFTLLSCLHSTAGTSNNYLHPHMVPLLILHAVFLEACSIRKASCFMLSLVSCSSR